MQLPDYKMVQGGNTRVNMSAGAAGQVGKAFASMGKDLEGAGMEVAGIFEAVEKQHNAGKMADLQLDLDQTYAGYQEKMAANPNNALQWRDEYSKLMESKQAELDKTDMSSNLRDQSNAYFKQFQGKTGIDVSRQMNNTILANSSKSIEVLVADLRRRGEDEQAQRVLDEGHKNGNVATARHLELSKDISYDGVLRGLGEQMAEDPQKFVDDAEAGRIKGISEEELKNQISKAKRLVSVNTMDNVNDMKNLIDGAGIKDEADLSQRMRDRKMDATSSYAMHQYFTDRNNEALSRFNNSPAQQSALIARFENGLLDYKPDGQPDDMGYAMRITMLDKIQNPHVKKEFIAKLDSLREGKEVAIKDRKDWAIDQLQKKNGLILEKHKANKPAVETKTLGYYLQDGWINKESNLTPYFDQDEIDQIMEAKDSNGDITQKARTDMFKKLFRNDPNRQGNTEFQRKMAYAITKGGMSTPVTKALDEGKMRAWVEQDAELNIRLGTMRESVMKRFEGRDMSEVPYAEINEAIGSARVHDDKETDWDDDLNISNDYQPKTEDDARFQDTYTKYATIHKLSLNPNDFQHHYDYRQAWEDGALRADTKGHLPSKYKTAGHPRTYMSPDGKSFSSRPKDGWTDTRTDKVVGDSTGVQFSSLIDLVKGFEGFNENAYDDHGQTSIGYGTVAAEGTTSISEEAAELELKRELTTHQTHVQDYAKLKGYKFTKNELNALTSFSYNIGSIYQLTANGTRTKAQIKKKMLEYVNASGQPVEGLKKRRAKEAELFGRG